MLKRYKQRKKYKRALNFDEKALHFMVKVFGSAALFFIAAIGMDAYHIFH
ncbi:MAG: hypothetical protein Q7S04_04780 [Candidatus Moranbacteria bacterium]|nr:hypothetical protein [Candidatus Moranbacteria bacterium]